MCAIPEGTTFLGVRIATTHRCDFANIVIEGEKTQARHVPHIHTTLKEGAQPRSGCVLDITARRAHEKKKM